MSRIVHTNIWSAYGYAKQAGYEGTEEEFEEGLKKGAEAAENAEASAESAAESAEAASASKDVAVASASAAAISEGNALNYATNAAGSASDAAAVVQTVNTKATEAAQSAARAETFAGTASTKASAATSSATDAAASASSAASSASNAANSATAAETAQGLAEDAQKAAEAAQTAAETAQTAAEAAQAAAEAVEESIPSDYSTLSNDVTELKSQINNVVIKSVENDFGIVTGYKMLVFAMGYYPVYNNGTVVDTSAPVTSTQTSKNMMTAITPCTAGDVFTVNVFGGSAERAAIGFLDADKKGIYKDAASGRKRGTVTAPENAAWFIVNNATANEPNPYAYKKIGDPLIEEKPETGYYANEVNPIYYKYILTNVGVGEVVDPTEVDTPTFLYRMFAVEKGDQFIITGQGGNNPRLWAFTDTEYKLISKAANNAILTDELMTAPADGYAIFNVNRSRAKSIIKLTKVLLTDAVNKAINEDIPKIRSNTQNLPTVKLDIPYNLRDFASEEGACDFAATTFMPQMYSLYDSLMEANPDYITKYDAALFDGLSLTYPEYANGIPAGHETYLETPAYKTYLYKFSSESIGAGHQSYCPKQKVLIICGTHGNERFAPFVIYLMMKSLCNIADENYFKMRSAFDFYVVPVLSGYGAYHDSRANANRVNLNRNFPTAGWSEANEGTVDYTGSAGGSEFETQLVMALAEKINPNVMIDAHNYGNSGERQFYAVLNDEKMMPLMHQCLVDCSCTFIKSLPQFFGTKWQLFIEDDAGSSPRSTGATTVPTTARWAYENGITNSATLEIAEYIKFVNGVYTSNGQEHYAATTMAVGEYTYRREFVAMLQYALDKIST